MSTLHDTLIDIQTERQQTLTDTLVKSYNVAAGLVSYDLEPAAKQMYPVLTPLRNRIPRVKGQGGLATQWRVITDINVERVSPGLGEGRRAGIIKMKASQMTASYRGFGLEDELTFEAEYAALGFDNVRALAVENLLKATMIAEERMIIGGNNSLALGTPSIPRLTQANTETGGTSTPAGNISVICVALNLEGWRRSNLNTGVAQTITRSNADGSTETLNAGSSGKSPAISTTVQGTGSTLYASVTPVPGAVGYAWYIGATGSETLQALSLTSWCKVGASTAGRPNVSQITTDCSQDAYAYDGLLSLAFRTDNNAQVMSLKTSDKAPATLTSDGAGGVKEIEDLLGQYWDNLKTGPSDLYMSAGTRKNVSRLIMQNGGNTPLMQIVQTNGDVQGFIGAPQAVRYLNRITGTDMQMHIHPELPDGIILFYSDGVPYPLSGVQELCQIKTRREYYQIEWPLRSRRYEYGVYCDAVLQHYFPPSLGILNNFAVV